MVDKTEFDIEVTKFYNFNCLKGKYYSCNYMFKEGDKKCFSRNHFIKTAEELIDYAWKYRHHDCYITYNPLKKPINRKNDNVLGLNVLALDIEFLNKRTPEVDTRLQLLKNFIIEVILSSPIFEIDNYMLIMSGNGYHLYLSLGKIIKRDTEDLKLAYKTFVKTINIRVNENRFGISVSVDDRKDLAGILRIPGTMNTKANRLVKIVAIKTDKDNLRLRKIFFKRSRAAIKESKLKKVSYTNCQTIIPKSLQELMDNPAVRMVFDTTLKQVDGWHHTVIFYVQSLVKESNLPPVDVRTLENHINNTWGTSISLGQCTTESSVRPLLGAIGFCKKNGFRKYEQELRALLKHK